MRRNATFWRNLVIVGLLHAAALFGLTRWSGKGQKLNASPITWMDLGTATAATAPDESRPEMPSAPSENELPAESEEEAAQDLSPEAPSEIVWPANSPIPTPTAARPHLTPKRAATPKPTPKETLLAKRPKTPRATPAPKKTVSVKPQPSKSGARTSSRASGVATGHGSGNTAEAATYANLLHDRFFSAWEQPTTVVATGAKMSTLVRVRIERDGRVSNFAVVRPSGNVVVDESVAAVGKRVTQVDAPPAGLGAPGHYDVNINFELNAE
jgi:TonB family protein